MITYWGNPRPDGSGGVVFNLPITIEGRWEQRAEQTFDGKGKEIVSKAVVFVDIDLDIGGYLFEGTSSVADPTTVEGAYEIKNFSKIANMGRTQHERKGTL